MIDDFDDFCTYVYIIVDDIWQQIAHLFKRPGPAPECSDSELIAMVLIGECRGWDVETEMLNAWQEYRHLFPNIPSQSRFNRRRRNLSQAFNIIRRVILELMPLTEDTQCVIDSLPVPVVQFYLVPNSTGDWKAYGAEFGKVASKKQTIFGYKLHLLITLNGIVIDFELAPANVTDLQVGVELLSGHTDLTVLGDKAYISAPVAEVLERTNGVRLLSVPRRNQKLQVSDATRRLFQRARQIIETVNSQLAAQFNIEHNHAHTFLGLCTRLTGKLAAHTLCIYINQLIDQPDFLQIKALAFAN